MVRTPSCDKSGMRKGTWTPEEDSKLIAYVTRYGSWNWRQLPRFAGLARCGKSCRLRWMNYLRPNVKRGNFTQQEEECIIRMHNKLGNRWSTIAAELPGRTDNEIKNHWHTTLKKRSQQNTLTKEEARASKSKDKVIPNKGVTVTPPATSSQFSDNSSLSSASSTSSEFFNITSDHSSAASMENVVFEDDDEFGFLDSNIDPMNNESFWKELTLDDISFNNAPIVSEDTNGSFQSTSSSNSNTLDSLHQSTSQSIVVDNDFGGFVNAFAEATVDNFWTQPFVADMSSHFPTEVLAASVAESEYFTPTYDDLWDEGESWYSGKVVSW